MLLSSANSTMPERVAEYLGPAILQRWRTPGPNKAVERTGHTTGFFPGWASVGCGPPLTAGVIATRSRELYC